MVHLFVLLKGKRIAIDPGRTFWDKVVILHGLRRWWDRRGEVRGEGQRVSRYHYDVHRLLVSDAREGFVQNSGLAADCV
jgi:hypothetical protein